MLVDYSVDLSPEECLESAVRFMVGRGYSIDLRGEDLLELSRRPEVSPWVVLLAVVLSLGTAGISFLALILILVFVRWKATVVATPTAGGGTRLTMSGSAEGTKKALREWVEKDLGEKARAF